MKKFGFKGLAALALAATAAFTSCKKDDDGNSLLDVVSNFEVTSGLDGFKTNVVYADKADAKTAKKSTALFDADKQTTIYAVKDKNFMSITFNGSEKGDYKLELTGTNPNTMIINYLTTDETLDETIMNSFSAETGCLIMYGSAEDGASSESLYVSTKAEVSITSIMKSKKAGSATKITGTFKATLMNSANDKKEVEGKFTCLGV